MPTDLDAAADGLYRLLPSEFVAARDTLAAEGARAAGEGALAREIKALRRPTQGAWMVNWLARERATDLGRLVDLGAVLRSAQERMAGDELRSLSRQRHAVVAALAREARRAAAEVGLQGGEAASRDVEDTLHAALTDDETAAAARAGHLSAALHHHGWGAGPFDQASAPGAGPASGAQLESRGGAGLRHVARAGTDRQARREAERRRQVEEAEAGLQAAQAAAAGARAVAGDHARGVEGARRQLDQLRLSVGDLEARLDALHAQEGDAARQLRDAERARDRAERRAAACDDELAAALATLQELRSAGPDSDPAS